MSAATPAVAGWCTFELAGGLYGVPLERTHEVLRPQPLTRVPLAPPAVAGLLNLRGQIVPALDPRVPLGLGAAPAGRPASGRGALVVVREASGVATGEVRSGSGLVALLVDDIGDVRRPPSAAAPAQACGHSTAESVHGAGPVVPALAAATVTLADRLLVVLDLDRLLQRAFERAGHDRGGPSPAPRTSGDPS